MSRLRRLDYSGFSRASPITRDREARISTDTSDRPSAVNPNAEDQLAEAPDQWQLNLFVKGFEEFAA